MTRRFFGWLLFASCFVQLGSGVAFTNANAVGAEPAPATLPSREGFGEPPIVLPDVLPAPRPATGPSMRVLPQPTTRFNFNFRGGGRRSMTTPIIPDQTRRAPNLLSALRPIGEAVHGSVGQVLGDGKEIILATIVRPDGLLVTKASELRGALTVRFGGSGVVLPATVVAVAPQHDLALLKVDAKNLKPVEWIGASEVKVGMFVMGISTESLPIGTGVVSVAARPTSGGMMGVQLRQTDAGVAVVAATPDMPAGKAGILPGDIIVGINSQTFDDHMELREYLQSLNAGTEIGVTVKRGEETLIFRLTLTQFRETENRSGPANRLSMRTLVNGAISTRNTNFPAVIQNDTILQPGQQGGPLVDLSGKAVGVNIARASRVETFTLPAAVVEALLPEMLAGKYPVPAGSELTATPATTSAATQSSPPAGTTPSPSTRPVP